MMDRLQWRYNLPHRQPLHPNIIQEHVALAEEFPYLQQRRRRIRKVIVDRMNPFVCMDDTDFIGRFRLRKETMHHLIQELHGDLPVYENQRGVPIPQHLQVLIAVAYMANGSHQSVIGDCMEVSTTSVCRCLSKVSMAIARLSANYIQFPDVDNIRQTQSEFYSIAGMPGVIGCIDCTHIAIVKPSCDNSELYRCRKGFFSINVQGICDAKLLFTNIVARWQGSVHDSRIFENSNICQILEGGAYKGHLLADGGYSCRTYMLTPVPTGNDRIVDQQTASYNKCHIKTRNTVERAFGVLKRRFSVLGKKMRTSLRTTKAIIVAAVVLHNLAVQTRLLEEEIDDLGDVAGDEQYVPFDHRRNIRGQAKREHIIRTHF